MDCKFSFAIYILLNLNISLYVPRIFENMLDMEEFGKKITWAANWDTIFMADTILLLSCRFFFLLKLTVLSAILNSDGF